MDNHGPCITIEEDVKLTDNDHNALNAINSKEIDYPAKRSMAALSGCSDVEKDPVCGVSLSHLKSFDGTAAKDFAAYDHEDQFVSMPKHSENCMLSQSKQIRKGFQTVRTIEFLPATSKINSRCTSQRCEKTCRKRII